MNVSLFFLALRRTLQPALVAATLFVAALAARSERAPEWSAGMTGLRAAAGVARAGVWTLTLLLLGPALLILAARALRRWRAGEADWLAPRASGPGAALVSTWLGGLAGALALALIPLAAGELAAGPGDGGWRHAGELELRDPAPTAAGDGLRWRHADPGAPDGSRVVFELDLGARSGPAAEVLVRATRLRDGVVQGERAQQRRLGRAAQIELALPPGPGELEFSLARVGAGATVALRQPALALLVPAGSARKAGPALLLHLLVALAAGGALALALACWTGAGTAGALLMGAWGAALLAPLGAPAGFPGVALASALAEAGEGFVPAAPSAAAWVGAAAAVTIGLGAARLGLRRWRGPA